MEIWNKSIKNNVIATLIAALIIFIISLIFSGFSNSDFLTAFKTFWNYKISIWLVVLAFICLYVLILLIKNRSNNNFKYDNETLELDQKLFNKIRNEMLTPEVMQFSKSNRFSSHAFNLDSIDFIYVFNEAKVNPNFEFFNPKLEQEKILLIQSIEKLEDSFNNSIFGTGNPEFVGIPKEWDIEKYKKASSKIRDAENNFNIQFDTFIKTGRIILKV